jgi:hypothetical protein
MHFIQLELVEGPRRETYARWRRPDAEDMDIHESSL